METFQSRCVQMLAAECVTSASGTGYQAYESAKQHLRTHYAHLSSEEYNVVITRICNLLGI